MLGDFQSWTSLSAVAIAGFALVVSWLAYQQSRVDIGRRKPIILSSIREVRLFRAPSENWRHMGQSDRARSKVLELCVFNQSSVAQSVRLTNFSIVWPLRSRHHLFDDGLEFDVPPYGGGNFGLRVLNFDWLDLPDNVLEKEVAKPQRSRYLVRLKGETLSGQKLSFLGWVTFRRYRDYV